MFAKNGLIDLADRCQAVSLFYRESKYDSTVKRIVRMPTSKIPLLMILNTPRCIKVAKGSAVIYCTRPGNDSYKG